MASMNPITQLRLELGLTTAQFAAICGFPNYQSWQSIEKLFPYVHGKSLAHLAKGLGTNVRNLLDDVHDLEGLNFAYESGVKSSESANGLMWAKVLPETDARRRLRAWFNAGRAGEDRPKR